MIPTYPVGPPDRNPMFLEKRVYQGSSGRVYPYPVIDRISDERRDERHPALFLENGYIKLMVLPSFGGRIQYAYDKTNGYGFIYHNRVIKPALVGLAGPWLSGGIEFNWPQHHRPGTYCPVDWAIEEKPDGSRTIWLSEIEPTAHLKGTVALTLEPGRAVVEVLIRLFNPTPLPQSFHLWTNPAVSVNDDYQSVFPPDVQAVFDHGKRDVSTFPIARGEYYKVDYSRGVDISWYKNLPVPTSYMAAESRYDFLGGYDHGRKAGVLHVADHQVVPGKKQWVWGCGDFGKAWDRNLTDDDGPYAELMCGVFADNQPDFAWLQPYEEKEVRQYFLPYKAIGVVRNATTEAAVSLDLAPASARLGVYVTRPRSRCRVRLSLDGETLWERIADLSPHAPLLTEVSLPAKVKGEDLRLEVASGGDLLVAYTPEPRHEQPAPSPARPIPPPRELETTEALYLAGLHLEQYRHATREAEDYYREALRRDPGDLRCNNALGVLLLRRGQIQRSEPFLRAAIGAQSRHNANPYDGEPHYHLGTCLMLLERFDEAAQAFAKAAWNAAWNDSATLELARLASRRGDISRALECVVRSLDRNRVNQKATHLQALLLRRCGRVHEARAAVDSALRRDPLDFGAWNEGLWLLRCEERLGEAQVALERLNRLMRGDPHTHIEIALDYSGAGAFDEASDLLERVAHETQEPPAPGHLGRVGMPQSRPMVLYHLGHIALQNGDREGAVARFREAAALPADGLFPNSLPSLLALQAALRVNPGDAHAAYALGNLHYDKRQVEEATDAWELAREADPRFPTVRRNLALAYFNKQHKPKKALDELRHAFDLDPRDARVLFELDLLRRRMGHSPERRLATLEAHAPLVETREDLLVEKATLLNTLGRHEAALAIILGQRFHPWEGGEGKVTGQYVVALVELAKRDLTRVGAPHALELLQRARCYPNNLGDGRLPGTTDCEIHYWTGRAHEMADRKAAAREAWEQAAGGRASAAAAHYYNDQRPEALFYQGLALDCLGRRAAARRHFTALVEFGRDHLSDRVEIDYFAVSLPEFLVFDDDLQLRNEVHCRHVAALGAWGMGRRSIALRGLRQVLRLDPSHQSARLHLAWRTRPSRGNRGCV